MTAKKHNIAFQYFFMIFFLSIPTLCSSQELKNAIYYGEDFFILEGTEIPDSLKEFS